MATAAEPDRRELLRLPCPGEDALVIQHRLDYDTADAFVEIDLLHDGRWHTVGGYLAPKVRQRLLWTLDPTAERPGMFPDQHPWGPGVFVALPLPETAFIDARWLPNGALRLLIHGAVGDPTFELILDLPPATQVDWRRRLEAWPMP